MLEGEVGRQTDGMRSSRSLDQKKEVTEPDVSFPVTPEPLPTPHPGDQRTEAAWRGAGSRSRGREAAGGGGGRVALPSFSSGWCRQGRGRGHRERRSR